MSERIVSVNVPCYQQLALAKRVVDGMLAQTFTPIEVTLIDDGASDEYREFVESLHDPRVTYRRNAKRLGAMRNMFAAIESGRGPYTLAFHEDDLLERDYLAAAVAILEAHPKCAFVACKLHEFTDDPPAGGSNTGHSRPAYDLFASSAEFLRGILRGVEPMFGSIVYRRAALSGTQPRHDRFGTLVDRPFLLSILHQDWSAAVIREPMVWYRHHPDGDARHRAMTTDHILNLFRTYRAELPGRWSEADRTLFLSYSGYWLLELYRLTHPEHRAPVRQFLFRAWREGLYDPRVRGHFGLRQIGWALLNRLP
jgi:glycosyltransferase involved in cell wall biosynthesis